MTKETNNFTEVEISREKKAYLTPKLHHYGGLAELTQMGRNPGNDGGGTNTGNAMTLS